MRNLKKFLALVLAMMMACSLVVTGSAAKWDSAAGDFDDQSGVTKQFEEGVAVVTGMKIFKGDAGTNDFRPAASIKRSEVAAIVYRLVTGDVGDDSAYLYTHVAPFTDVNPDDWFAGYVGYLWNAEIIKGSNTERTEFNPYGEVTGYEALAMVLRALGYDANDEFTGAGWQVRVGQYANKTGLLTNVNATNYGAGHLNAAARRDTVAEIIFQAANADLVIYTPAFGYETTNVNAGTNVVVNTLGWTNFGLTWDRGIVVGNQATGEKATKMGIATLANSGSTPTREYPTGRITADSYNYLGISALDATNNQHPGPVKAGSMTLSFDHETPLTQFGHANKVWYRSNGASTLHTYAWFDEATKTAVVHTNEEMDTSDAVTNINADLYVAVKAAGFTVETDPTDKTTVIAFGSDKYDRMAPLSTSAASIDQRIIDAGDKDDVASDKIHMYSLVSNSADNKLDVIISLDAEVARIYDTNTTATSERIVLENATLGDTTTSRPGGEILTGNLTSASVKTLGASVEAWVVDGTTKDPAPNRNIDSLYETIAVKQGPTGLVSTIDGEGTVTLANGQQLKRSYLWDVVKSGVKQEGITAGVNLSFVVDQWGRYLGLSSDPGYSFIYGTFADHNYGAVGSGDLSYLVCGVDANGGKITNHALTRMQRIVADAPNFNPLDGNVFNDIEVARRDYGTFSNGNQITDGVYRAGVITADGRWLVNDDDANGQGVAGYYNVADKALPDWSFTAADVANGFKDLAGDGTLLLTPNTVFYVVSGTGTATLNVKTYSGMAAFLDGASAVTIDVNYDEGGAHNYDVAYMTNRDTYNSVGLRDEQNAMVTKVFVYEDAVDRVDNATMFYAHCSTPTGLEIAGFESAYDQYELWQGGTKVSYFIDENDTINPDQFYNLVKAGTKNGIDVYNATVATVDDVRTATPAGNCWTKQDFMYFATNDTSTARIGDSGSGNETVYRVDKATVVDLTTSQARHDSTDSHASHNQINNVKDLFNAISVGYGVKVSIVNKGVDVSMIYVVEITAP